jgi:cyclic beta-1,2-glucan synthetase
MKSFIVPSYNSKSGTLFAQNTYNAEFSDRVAFLSANRTPHGLTTDRKEFFGSPGNRNEPAGLKRVGLSGKLEAGLDPCGALQTHWDFEPGETQTIIYVIGQGKNRAQAMKLAEKFSQTEQFQISWDNVQKMWDQLLNKIQVETPDKQMNFILNRWLLYQALSCRIWGRSAFYQSSGAYGFRDQLQDVASLLATKPEIARKHILRSAKHQFDAGDVLHWWHPPSGRGVRTRITDDLLWLVYTTYEYIEKTGDRSILDEEIAFRIGDPLEEDEEERYAHFETTEEKYTLFEHCRRALEHGDTKGPHGLPLIGSGDWNDGMNRVGIKGSGESVWLGWFLLENHKRFAEICEWHGQSELAEQHRLRAEELNKVINDVAWDDDWYLRAYYDDGTPLGSHRSEECQIDSLPQSWSVLTGEAPQERVEKALASVEKHLVHPDDRLIQLFTPPFDKTKKDPGYIKGYPPGVRENGGQYTHAAIWAIWALTEVGLGNKAFKQFQLLNPISHSLDNESANRYTVEPYVIAADVYSRPPYTGRGGWTWYTGSSGWFYRLGVEAILGFTIAGDYLVINPCIPEEWDGFEITYRHKKQTYHIKVQNPDHIQKGVRMVKLDGKPLDNGKIPLAEDKKDYEIIVIMGK